MRRGSRCSAKLHRSSWLMSKIPCFSRGLATSMVPSQTLSLALSLRSTRSCIEMLRCTAGRRRSRTLRRGVGTRCDAAKSTTTPRNGSPTSSNLETSKIATMMLMSVQTSELSVSKVAQTCALGTTTASTSMTLRKLSVRPNWTWPRMPISPRSLTGTASGRKTHKTTAW